MENTKKFKSYDPDQLFLLPPDIKSWLPEDDLAYFIIDVVNRIDLRAITKVYDSSRGQPAYHPRMMTSLLIYAYCKGVASSRQIEQATNHSVPFRVVTSNQHPVQVLQLCQKAGLVKLGHVALDGTKVKANASKHKAMSYGRMEKKSEELRQEVERLLSQAQEADGDEDRLYGKGKREKELPEELRFKQSRLRKIEEAMQALEEEARAEAEVKRREQDSKKKGPGRPPQPPSGKTDSKQQRNFSDPESRIMPAKGSKDFVQGYNCQIAVDESAQVIVSSDATQESNDKKQLRPLVEKLENNLGGSRPKVLSADSGYFSESNCQALQEKEIDGFIATGKYKHG